MLSTGPSLQSSSPTVLGVGRGETSPGYSGDGVQVNSDVSFFRN